MANKIAIDSKGEVHNIEKEINICDLINVKQRVATLYQFAGKLIPLLKKCGFNVEPYEHKKTFDYIFQPFGVHECIVFFIKTPISSTSNEVKLSYLLKNDSKKAELMKSDIANGIRTKYTDDMLLSIVPTKEKGENTIWWLLNAVIIEIERNKYDGKIISIKPEKLIPYHKFCKIFEGKIIENTVKIDDDNEKKNDNVKESKKTTINIKNNKYKYCAYSPSTRELFKEDNVLKTSIEYAYGTDVSRYEKVQDYLEKVFLPMQDKLDKYSNIRSNCLNFIISNPHRQIYPVYDKIKIELLKIEEINTVYYRGSRIYFKHKTFGSQCIYVCNEKNEETYKNCRYVPSDKNHFILNGHTYNNIAEIVDAIINHEKTKCFEAEPWFIKEESIDIVNFYFPTEKNRKK